MEIGVLDSGTSSVWYLEALFYAQRCFWTAVKPQTKPASKTLCRLKDWRGIYGSIWIIYRAECSCVVVVHHDGPSCLRDYDNGSICGYRWTETWGYEPCDCGAVWEGVINGVRIRLLWKDRLWLSLDQAEPVRRIRLRLPIRIVVESLLHDLFVQMNLVMDVL